MHRQKDPGGYDIFFTFFLERFITLCNVQVYLFCLYLISLQLLLIGPNWLTLSIASLCNGEFWMPLRGNLKAWIVEVPV